jgi:hypothetical protein
MMETVATRSCGMMRRVAKRSCEMGDSAAIRSVGTAKSIAPTGQLEAKGRAGRSCAGRTHDGKQAESDGGRRDLEMLNDEMILKPWRWM